MSNILQQISIFRKSRRKDGHLGRMLCTMILLFFLVISCSPGREIDQQEEGVAPDFTLRDLNGQAFHLKAERGKTVLMIFTTTWCPSCRELIPAYRELYQVYGERGLVMVNVNIQEPLARVREFAKNNQIPYRILLDEDGSVGMVYGVMGVPAMILINQDGELISSDTMTILEILGKMFPDPGPPSLSNRSSRPQGSIN
ncbi:MAG: TlpA family protein disulfide reductase [Syntrophales bacterium]|jgi:peroxiredoxin|nr:TlpA family protein disulfide reductase [Syntrophales bacterium]